jgi:four helix bundle protein
MARDVRKLKVFHEADELVVPVYRVTRSLPPEERFALQVQIRKAAVSTVTNLVEGCARRTTRDYLRFVEISLGSASETRYLLELIERLYPTADRTLRDCISRYGRVIRALQNLLTSLEHAE